MGNKVTMPSRNWAVITENSAGANPTPVTNGNGAVSNGNPEDASERQGTSKAKDRSSHGKGADGSLDICIRVEKDQHDSEGKTQSYGLTIPTLKVEPGVSNKTLEKRHPAEGTVQEHH